MRPWYMTLETLDIDITMRMVIHLRLENMAYRWKPLNIHNVILRLMIMIIGLLMISDLRRTWNINLMDLEFNLDREEIWISRRDDY